MLTKSRFLDSNVPFKYRYRGANYILEALDGPPEIGLLPYSRDIPGVSTDPKPSDDVVFDDDLFDYVLPRSKVIGSLRLVPHHEAGQVDVKVVPAPTYVWGN